MREGGKREGEGGEGKRGGREGEDREEERGRGKEWKGNGEREGKICHEDSP